MFYYQLLLMFWIEWTYQFDRPIRVGVYVEPVRVIAQ